MVIKTLNKSEIQRGFIQIPTESLPELIGNSSLPCPTILNGNPARLDKYGRLWSSFLKNKFAVGTKVEISKTENGLQVTSNEISEGFSTYTDQQKEPVLLSKSDTFHRVLEGDCLKYFDERSINNIHMTFLDPPYRQGKDYRFFDDNQPASKY